MLAIHSTSTLIDALSACSKLDQDTLGGCMHGAGHEALLFSDYNVPEALQMCNTFARTYASSSSAILSACTFGVFMENAEPGMMGGMAQEALDGGTQMSGMDMNDAQMDEMDMSSTATLPAVHEDWTLRKSDPSFPCDASAVAAQYRSGCWRMQTVVLANELSGRQIVALCDGLSDPSQKAACFVGFADGAVSSPDIDVPEVFSDCSYATGAGWKDTCIIDFVDRAYLNGYGNAVPDEICSQIDASGKAACEAAQRAASS
jgi:hypothetical protein